MKLRLNLVRMKNIVNFVMFFWILEKSQMRLHHFVSILISIVTVNMTLFLYSLHISTPSCIIIADEFMVVQPMLKQAKKSVA